MYSIILFVSCVIIYEKQINNLKNFSDLIISFLSLILFLPKRLNYVIVNISLYILYFLIKIKCNPINLCNFICFL